ncbi:hypothetical protein H072_411 [Dactylellina haptotyla CBS 200.50]|uniref:Uncharacterized protein n=1 Tax=Dactylellina haptotyla (strain CBS 200.50) TaxID=1284197 RepID=S8CD31_DACHA|nr:hypothetical protein H072_411 [Dactylellina haptotyla CBS 200.50]
MAAQSSPSKLLSSTNLSLSNSSPWRLKVTVEAEPDSDIFLDLAQEESLTSQNTTKRQRKPKDRSNTSNMIARKTIIPLKGSDETGASEDSLGLDNTTGIFAPKSAVSTPQAAIPRRQSKTPNAVIIPLKGSEPKEKQPKRKGTPARKKVKEVDLSVTEPDLAAQKVVATPKRGRGRPRKSIENVTEVSLLNISSAAAGTRNSLREDNNESMGLDKHHTPTPAEETMITHIPSPPSSPNTSFPQAELGASAEASPNGHEDPSIVASEGFSMIDPKACTSTRTTAGLNTPRPTPEAEEIDRAEAVKPRESALIAHKSPELNFATATSQRSPLEELNDIADDVAALSIQPGPRRRRSLRLASKPNEEKQTSGSVASSTVMERFRELASKASKGGAVPSHSAFIEPRDDASSFRRFLESEPAKVVPGTYEESTVYFAQKIKAQAINRRKQTPAKKRAPIETRIELENSLANIIPEHLLGPANARGLHKKVVATANPANDHPPDLRGETPDLFGEEGRSVRWHDDVVGGSFSLNSSSTERIEPEPPKQESTHRLLENEVIIEPFRPSAGKLKDGTEMPLVVPREWTNYYWAILTEIAYPDIDLALRSQRPMSGLHPKEDPEQAMERRRKILQSFSRNEDGYLILSEQDSGIIDTFEEHMRREIVGEKRVAGETRRMWGFSRNQIKEALVVLQVSRQRRIQWVVSAGENPEDWGLA